LFAFEQIILKPTNLLLKTHIFKAPYSQKEYQDSALGYVFPEALPVRKTAMQ